MAQGQKIRIRLKAYDHEVIDQSAKKIVETVLRTQAVAASMAQRHEVADDLTVGRGPDRSRRWGRRPETKTGPEADAEPNGSGEHGGARP